MTAEGVVRCGGGEHGLTQPALLGGAEAPQARDAASEGSEVIREGVPSGLRGMEVAAEPAGYLTGKPIPRAS